MSAIGGPGGIGGPKGPLGPDSPDNLEGPDVQGGPDGPEGASEASQLAGPEASAPGTEAQPVGGVAEAGDLERLAADLRAGKLTAHEAVARLVAQMADAETLPPADRAELRELMTDLIASDPHLGALVSRLG